MNPKDRLWDQKGNEFGVRVFFLILWILVLGIISKPAHALEEKIIHVATEATYPPFVFVKKSGEIIGFDIDLMQTICERAHLRCIFSNQPFDTLIPGLMARKFQAIIGAISITRERAKEVAFSQAYYQPIAGFITNKGSLLHLTPQGMQNISIATQRGTVFEEYIQACFPKVNLHVYATFEDAFLDLQAERVQAVIGDVPTLLAFSKRNGNKYTLYKANIPSHLNAGFAVGFRSDAAGLKLRDIFNQKLAHLQQDGTLARLREKWSV